MREGVLEVDLVDPTHQAEVALCSPDRLVVDAGTRHAHVSAVTSGIAWTVVGSVRRWER